MDKKDKELLKKTGILKEVGKLSNEERKEQLMWLYKVKTANKSKEERMNEERELALKHLAISQLTEVLVNNLDYAVKSMVTDIPREEVLKETADQMYEISNKIQELKDLEMDDKSIKDVMVMVFKEWDNTRLEKWQKEIEKEWNNEDEA